MLKNLLIAVGLLLGLTATGCNLYFEDQSSAPSQPPGGGGGGSGGSGGVGQPLPPGYDCSSDAQCAAGCYCGDGTCVEGGFCTTDRDCGDGLTCDEGRNSCDPQGGGSCAGAVTCTDARPNCPADTVALVENGCWTGACEALAQCDAAPPCDRLNTEPSCLARAECGAVYNGLNCRRSDGTACQAGDTGCTCESFVFASCAAD
jgi:hypothetical protein